MPYAALRPCTHPRCGKLTHGGRCDEHRLVVQREVDQQRGSSSERGYDSKWRKARAGYLRSHPLCECDECQAGAVRVMPAEVVDHKVPHRGDMKLFWDSSNWQAMSKACHDKKTAREDGGFGNTPKAGRG